MPYFTHYPFGSTLPTRSWSDVSRAYKYGFNGKEKDSEGMGGGSSTYDYGFRIYNPNLGKFLSVDPLFRSFPWNSTYSFAENDVIRSIDIDGLEKYVVTRCWVNGSFKGIVCMYLPNTDAIRLYKADNANNNHTVVLNLNLNDADFAMLKGVYLEKDVNDVLHIKPNIDKIIFNKSNNIREMREDALVIEKPVNKREEKALVECEKNIEKNLYMVSFILAKTMTYQYNFDDSKTIEINKTEIEHYKEFLTNNPDYIITVTGHTDKKGDEKYNTKLGMKRAEDVKAYLVKNGIDASRIKTESKGESEALVNEDSPEKERQSDRKVVIQWTPKDKPKP